METKLNMVEEGLSSGSCNEPESISGKSPSFSFSDTFYLEVLTFSFILILFILISYKSLTIISAFGVKEKYVGILLFDFWVKEKKIIRKCDCHVGLHNVQVLCIYISIVRTTGGELRHTLRNCRPDRPPLELVSRVCREC